MFDLRLAIEDAPVGDMPVKIRCLTPEHGPKDTQQSMAVYPDNIHCFGCGFHRNDADACLALLLHISFEEARAHLQEYTNEALDTYRERATQLAIQEPLPTAHAVLYNELLRGDVFGDGAIFADRCQWLYDRGLTNATIDRACLGYDGERFVIPIFDAEYQLLSLRYRADPERCTPDYLAKHKYLGLKGRNGRYLYPAPLLARDERDWVVICEGELDSLILWQQGIPTATLTNGAGQCKRLPEMLPARIQTVYIATDSDEAGETAAHEVAQACAARGLAFYRLTAPVRPDQTPYKDITDAYVAGYRLHLDPTRPIGWYWHTDRTHNENEDTHA